MFHEPAPFLIWIAVPLVWAVLIALAKDRQFVVFFLILGLLCLGVLGDPFLTFGPLFLFGTYALARAVRPQAALRRARAAITGEVTRA